MEILHVSSSAYDIGKGEAEYVRNISERLARNHEVTVFAVDTSDRLPRHETINGVSVERFRSYAPGDAFFLSWELMLRLRKTHTDILHGHNYHSFPFHVASLARHKRFFVSPLFHGAGHSSITEGPLKLFKLLARGRTLEKADRVMAASEHERLLLLKNFDLRPDRVVVIPRGVNFSEYRDLKRQKTTFRTILYVGRLVPYKGVQYLVEVMPKLPSDVILEVVGKGPLRRSLEERAKKLKVADRVKFFQNLERRDLVQMYANADLFILLSIYEAYSKVVAESLIAGTPCIVANTSALEEWVDNESCFGVDVPIRLDELANLIVQVIGRRISGTTIEKWKATKIPDWEDVVRKLEDIYAG